MSDPKQKLPWSNPHGRLRELERAARARISLGPGEVRFLAALLQAMDARTGRVEMLDEVLAIRVGVQNRSTLWRYRNALRAEGLIDFEVGRPRRPTKYWAALPDTALIAELAELDRRIVEAYRAVEGDRSRRAGVADLRRRKASEHIIAEASASQDCNAAALQTCDAYLPLISPSVSFSEKTEDRDLVGEGLSDGGEGRGATANEDIQRQAYPETETRRIPPLDDDAERAIEAFRQDRRALHVVGQGDRATLDQRLRCVRRTDLAEIAGRWAAGEYPRRRCPFRDVLAVAVKAEEALNKLIRHIGAPISAFAISSQLDEAEREGVLGALADEAGPDDPRIAHAVEAATARDAEARRQFAQRQAEARMSPEERERRDALKSRFAAIEAEAAGPEAVSLADIHRRLGNGDEARGRRMAEALGAAHVARLGHVAANGGALRVDCAFDDARALAVTLIDQEEASHAEKA